VFQLPHALRYLVEGEPGTPGLPTITPLPIARLPMTRCLYIVLLTTLTIAGCDLDKEQVAAQAYVERMTPLLKRNTTLSRTLLDIAAKIKKDQLSTADVAEQFGSRVVPQSAKLRDDVATIRPIPKTAKAVHIGLVRAWGNRARAYQQMHEAWVSGDLATFNGAARDNETVSKAEERYFESVNTVLEPFGLTLRQYPRQQAERVSSDDVSKAKRGKASKTKEK
jgi:hypothetical protein